MSSRSVRRHVHKAKYERERRKRLGELFRELNHLLLGAGVPFESLGNQVDSLEAAISILKSSQAGRPLPADLSVRLPLGLPQLAARLMLVRRSWAGMFRREIIVDITARKEGFYNYIHGGTASQLEGGGQKIFVPFWMQSPRHPIISIDGRWFLCGAAWAPDGCCSRGLLHW